jgi:hypothetical protein
MTILLNRLGSRLFDASGPILVLIHLAANSMDSGVSVDSPT